jgi:hypothetical protein
MHLVADVFTISKAVLNEWNFVAGEEVQVAALIGGDFRNSRAFRTHVPPVPKSGRKRIGVANQNPVCISGGDVLATILLFGYGLKFFSSPGWIVCRDFHFRIFTSEFRDPNRFEFFRQSFRKRCGAC